jgi:hypothetical protein
MPEAVNPDTSPHICATNGKEPRQRSEIDSTVTPVSDGMEYFTRSL